ncbi:pilus assembly protein CpaB [Marinactinospora thermotolerans DSM 45154]|uniref:Pilus assembly protein CpaB n=1 Tax=Marinactinospora thermotolerans DSM 45154 TaxID=1122192 RepID=A0A1T4RPL4_9ACTN|nr:Flp pilus assembly protein CpaB [Marinactinospora thermotolerans]SKA17688.1 pilus assembly protein CpaB [Marinactinospora thermotolerans DSM 45154]
MNPRQRRGVMLMIVAGIGAIAVFFTVVSYVNTLQNEMGSYRTALRLTQDVPPYQPITEDMIEEYEVPAKFFDADVFLSDLSQAVEQPGRQVVSATFLNAGSLLQKSMVIAAPELENGEREIAIMIDAETGVAGKVDRQSRVDVYAAYQPNDQQAACAVRVLTNVEVLEVGELGSEIDENTGATNAVVPVTFRLTAEQTLQLTYAEGFASKLRLALVSPEGAGDPGGLEFCSSDQADLLSGQNGGATPGNGEQ